MADQLFSSAPAESVITEQPSMPQYNPQAEPQPFNPAQFNFTEYMKTGQGMPAEAQQPAPKTTTQFEPSPVAPQAPAQPSKLQALDEQTASQLEKAYQTRGAATQALGEYQQKRAEAAGAEYEKTANQMMAAQGRVNDQLGKINKAVDDQVAVLDKYRKDLDGFQIKSPEIQVNSPFTNGTTGQKIMAGIALALGAYGGALSGSGKNMAMDVLNNAIDRDLQVQKENARLGQETEGRKMQLKQMQMGAGQNMLQAMQQKFGNTMQAEAATKALMLETAKMRIDGLAAKYEAPEFQQKAAILKSQIDEEQAKTLYQFKAAAANREMMQVLGQKMSGGELPKLSPAEEAALPKELRETLKEKRERWVPGFGEAVNKEQANKFQEYVAETGPALKNGKEVLELAKKMNFTKSLSPEARAQMESRLAILAGQLRLPITGPGALTADEYKRLRETLGDPAKIVSLKAVEMKKLQTVIEFLNSSIKERAKQAGLSVSPQLGTPHTPEK